MGIALHGGILNSDFIVNGCRKEELPLKQWEESPRQLSVKIISTCKGNWAGESLYKLPRLDDSSNDKEAGFV